MPACSASRSRRSASRPAILAVLTVASCLAACSPNREETGTVSGVASSRSTRGSVGPAGSDPPPVDAGPRQYPVGMTLVEIPDPVRGHPLRTHVRYPAAPGSGGPDAPPDGASFPLVLMAHGYRLPPDGYERLLQGVAARGYVVAAPEFPHTSPAGDGDRSDLVNQPAELSLVADGIIAESARPGALVPRIDRPERLAVMGHSDGGLTAAAMAYNDAYRDPRVNAVVVMTGGRGDVPGGWSVPDPPPLLAIHGDADTVNPPSASADLTDVLPPSVPRYLVTVHDGDHLAPYMGDTAIPGLATLIADFLYVHLQRNGDRGAADRLHADANTPPLTLTAE